MEGLTERGDGARDDGSDESEANPATAQPAPPASRRVLAGSLLDRLVLLNGARRALRDLDLRVARVIWCDGRPFIEIEREPGVSLAPLLDRMGRRMFRCANGRTRIAGEFMGVTVCWFEWSSDDAASGERGRGDVAAMREGVER
ncbi:hypothetical protein C0Z18_11780 [Trinickia dabaoshanensis]|uniref:Uncharacterized protein n=1 Tax=Trinickia dabaoshanensis TaxID=564714 RepID=A0A2N7VSF1_9BURK|nr:hypothetical protein [Trinickia dabaoshanensis]PMS20084.1 hypothetical protein C0Z18_11780 [Trinickia dabaoshanensis]